MAATSSGVVKFRRTMKFFGRLRFPEVQLAMATAFALGGWNSGSDNDCN